MRGDLFSIAIDKYAAAGHVENDDDVGVVGRDMGNNNNEQLRTRGRGILHTLQSTNQRKQL